MQDENITTSTNEQLQQSTENRAKPQEAAATHCFYQLSGELLSKPKALCDIIELEGRPSTIVFCNLPSDTDMVEAVLNRQGISATKIIGNVPQLRVSKTVRAAQAGEITTIVVTDIGARYIEVEGIDLIINYSIPEDPEIYLHRIGNSGLGGKLHKIISFVNPLDISNFHYLKKLVGFPFIEMALPSQEDLLKAKFDMLRRTADFGPHLEVEHIKSFAATLSKSQNDHNLLSLLIYNTLEILPSLQANSTSNKRRNDEETFSERKDRGGYRQQRERNSSRSDRRHSDNNSNSRSSYQERRGGSSFDDNNQESRSGKDYGRHERPQRRSRPTVTVNETRVYLGAGTEQDFSEEAFKKILSEHCPDSVNELKRFSLRKCYAFADFPEEVATKLIEQLRDKPLENGSRLTLINAATISTHREEEEETLSQDNIVTEEQSYCCCEDSCKETPVEESDNKEFDK